VSIESVEFIASVFRKDQVPKPARSEVAFFGRSNVGKSTLINCLLGKKMARTSSTPGKTQCLNYYLINGQFYLVDAPGYGYAKVPAKLRDSWKKAIDAWLMDNRQLQLIVMILDARLTPQKSDLQMADWLNHYRIPSVIVANKVDQLKNSERSKNMEHIEKAYGTRAVIPASALTGEGKNEILRKIMEAAGKVKKETL
jgi:GTP-binding protein